MAFEYTTLAWQQSEAAGNTRLVLLVLADRANEQGECWPSIADLCRRTKASERTVQAALRELEKLGEIEVDYNSGQRGSNRYRITIEASSKEAKPTPAKSAPPAKIAPPQISHPTPADSAPESIKNLSLESTHESSCSNGGDDGPDLDKVTEQLYDSYPATRKAKPRRSQDIRTIRSVVLEPGTRSMADHCRLLLAATRAMARYYAANSKSSGEPGAYNPTPGIRKFFIEDRLWDQSLSVWETESPNTPPPAGSKSSTVLGQMLYGPQGEEVFFDSAQVADQLASGWKDTRPITRRPASTRSPAALALAADIVTSTNNPFAPST